MNILITGGTGFIGKTLVEALKSLNQMTVLARKPEQAQRQLGVDVMAHHTFREMSNLDDFSVVINLAGAPIAQGRWTAQRKREICDSRWQLTQEIVEKINAGQNPPKLLINASAIGYYGRQGDHFIDESFQDIHHEFTHDVCVKWESIAQQAQSEHTRVCILRFGVVLGQGGGALQRMLPAYRFGLGGPLGSGAQWMSWIHRKDVIRIIEYCITQESLSGVLNATAPQPVTNRDFSAQLAKTLRRPHLFFVPGFVLRLALGEMADLLLYGQRVVPKRLLDDGFTFSYPTLETALQDILLK